MWSVITPAAVITDVIKKTFDRKRSQCPQSIADIFVIHLHSP